MNFIQIKDDNFNSVVINADLFLYAECNTIAKNDHILYIYLANKDNPIEIKLYYEYLPRLEEALLSICNYKE